MWQSHCRKDSWFFYLKVWTLQGRSFCPLKVDLSVSVGDSNQHIICNYKGKVTMAAQGFFVPHPPYSHMATVAFQCVRLSVCWQGTKAPCLRDHPKVKAKTSRGLYFLKVVIPTGSKWWTWSDYHWNVCSLMICSLSLGKQSRPPLKICRFQLRSPASSLVSCHKHLKTFHNMSRCWILTVTLLMLRTASVWLMFFKLVFHTHWPIATGGNRRKSFCVFFFSSCTPYIW